MTKTLTTEMRHIDVRQLARKKLLVPGYHFKWEWRHHRTLGLQAAIELKIGEGCITFYYQISNQEQSRKVVQRVQLVTSPCHYGGHRYWFSCPCCNKRAAMLYINFNIACRSCYQLAYKVQNESARDRAYRRLDKLREKLGWKEGLLPNRGNKPPGMHWRTYWQLLEELDRQQRPILAHLAQKSRLSEYFMGKLSTTVEI